MTNTIETKAWGLKPGKIVEDYYFCNDDYYIVYANSRGKAVSKLLKLILDSDIKLISGEEIKFTNVPIMRIKEKDLVELNGKYYTPYQYNIEKIKIKRTEFYKYIEENPNITHCIISKNGYYYLDNYCGYTTNYSLAGVYPKLDAIQHAKGCLEIVLKPIENKDEHNREINNTINSLKSHII